MNERDRPKTDDRGRRVPYPAAPDRVKSRRLLIVSFVLGAGLAVGASVLRPPKGEVIRELQIAPSTAEPSTPAPLAARPSASVQPTEATGILVRVVDSETGTTIAGATVRLLAVPVVWPARVSRRIGAEFATTTTNTSGVAKLPGASVPPDAGRRLMASASATGYAEALSAVPADAASVEIRLSAEQRISGLVIDSAGKPVPAVTVVATDVGASPVSVTPGEPDLTPVEPHAISGEDGRFAIAGIEPGRLYDVLPVSDGWTLAPTPPSRSASARSVASGSDNVRVEVARVVGYKIRCVDADTRAVIARAPFVSPLSSGTDKPKPWGQGGLNFSSVGNGTSTALPAITLFPDYSGGVTQGFALLDGDSPSDFVRLHVDVFGYGSGSVKVRPIKPSELETASAEDVLLKPTVARERGSLRILETPRETDCLRASQRGVKATESGKDPEFLWARQTAAGWSVAGVPVGRLSVAVNDGLGWSHPVDVELLSGRDATVNVSYPRPTGMTIEMQSETGERLYQADFVVPTSKSGRKSAAIDAARYTAFALDPRGNPTKVFCPLVPGVYVLSLRKAGFQWASVPFEVVEGTVTAVPVVLTRTDAAK